MRIQKNLKIKTTQCWQFSLSIYWTVRTLTPNTTSKTTKLATKLYNPCWVRVEPLSSETDITSDECSKERTSRFSLPTSFPPSFFMSSMGGTEVQEEDVRETFVPLIYFFHRNHSYRKWVMHHFLINVHKLRATRSVMNNKYRKFHEGDLGWNRSDSALMISGLL